MVTVLWSACSVILATPSTDPPTTFAAPQSKKYIVLNFTLFLFSTNYIDFAPSVGLIFGVVVGVSVLACVISVLVPVLVCYCLGVGVFGAIGCCLAKNKGRTILK